MNLWITGFAVAICLLLVALIAKSLKDRMWAAQNDRLYESPLKVMVTDIQTKQDWRYGEGWYRNPWNGNVARERIWQTYYVITAQWIHPQTKRMQSFCWAVWSNSMPKKPVIGDRVLVTIEFDNSDAANHVPIDHLRILRVRPYLSLSNPHQ